jgi:hypothetical protein
MKERKSHIWERAEHEHYVEPSWCSERLFQEEEFTGKIHDPCCGFGTIPKAAQKFGFPVTASDIVDRGYKGTLVLDFFKSKIKHDNIVCNPPFIIAQIFTEYALVCARDKVAIIFPVARLNAAHWVRKAPLYRVWLLSPRPSMPPGHVVSSGGKISGGKQDFCWLVFKHGYRANGEVCWLYRDKGG